MSDFFSNGLLSAVVVILLLSNRNWHFRSLLILVLCSNLNSILRHSLFADSEQLLPYLSRLNVWLNIGIGYFTFLLFHDVYQSDFAFLRRKRIAFIRYLTIAYGLILLYFLTQDSFILSMLSYGLPTVLLLGVGFFTRPPRWILIIGSLIIICASAYLSLAPRQDTGILKPGDIYHYGLAVGLIIFHRAFNR